MTVDEEAAINLVKSQSRDTIRVIDNLLTILSLHDKNPVYIKLRRVQRLYEKSIGILESE